jgi:hypothetical protein
VGVTCTWGRGASWCILQPVSVHLVQGWCQVGQVCAWQTCSVYLHMNREWASVASCCIACMRGSDMLSVWC